MTGLMHLSLEDLEQYNGSGFNVTGLATQLSDDVSSQENRDHDHDPISDTATTASTHSDPCQESVTSYSTKSLSRQGTGSNDETDADLTLNDQEKGALAGLGIHHCPDSADAQALSVPADDGLRGMMSAEITTVMLKNIPGRCTQSEVLSAIDAMGFDGAYDFFYLPILRAHNVGYAFVGFKDADDAERFARVMTGFRFPNRKSPKVCEVVPAHFQGLQKNLSRFRKANVWRSKRALHAAEADAASDAPEKSQPYRNKILLFF